MSEAETAQVWPKAEEPATQEQLAQVLTGEIAKLEGQNLTVQKCAACDGKHEAIQMREYARRPVPFTHYYLCPTLGDPVPVALAMMTNGGAMELSGTICQALAAAQVSGRFMVATFWLDDDRRLRMHLHEQKFPTGDYFEDVENGRKGVLGLLREQFEKTTGTLQQQAMRRAATPKPIRELFGNAAPQQGVDQQQFKIPPESADAMAAAVTMMGGKVE